jgi:hypothetical protein
MIAIGKVSISTPRKGIFETINRLIVITSSVIMRETMSIVVDTP